MAREVECGLYGDYIWCASDKIQEAKELLVEQMVDTIKELAKRDDFWIVKNSKEFTGGPVPAVPENDCTVAWKIHFPQMEPEVPEKDYKQRMIEEYWQVKHRYNKLHDMLIKYEAGTLDFTPTCSLELLTKQAAAMGNYLKCLEIRAQIDGIQL